MKTKSILFSVLLASIAFMCINCGGNKKEAAQDSLVTANTDPSAPQFAVDANFQKQLAGVFNAYVFLKNAFVSSDASKVSAEAAATGKSLAAVDMKLLTGVAHNDWMNYLGVMETSLKAIESSKDIGEQRAAFSTLSDNLYKSIRAYGLGGTTAYYEFCPMAFDNQGAFWLSEAKEIRNPYFGDEMLTCGSVKETLK